jgi:hypothetical protein
VSLQAVQSLEFMQALQSDGQLLHWELSPKVPSGQVVEQLPSLVSSRGGRTGQASSDSCSATGQTVDVTRTAYTRVTVEPCRTACTGLDVRATNAVGLTVKLHLSKRNFRMNDCG